MLWVRSWLSIYDLEDLLAFDVPWFGGTDWKTMYDFPRHRAHAQHMSM